MPTYTDKDACLAYIEGLTVADDAAFDRKIEKAERDVDRALGLYYGRDDVTGLKIDPTTLTQADADVLSRATCAQVEYRIEMGEAFFTRPQFATVQGPDYATTGTLPYVGPAVMRELEQSPRLLRLAAPWDDHRGAPPWDDFARNTDADGPEPRSYPTNR